MPKSDKDVARVIQCMHKPFIGCANTGPIMSLGQTEINLT